MGPPKGSLYIYVGNKLVSLGTPDGLLLDTPCYQMFKWTSPKYPCWHILQMTPRSLYMPLNDITIFKDPWVYCYGKHKHGG